MPYPTLIPTPQNLETSNEKQNAAEEDETLRGIVKRDEVGKWKEKAEKLNKAMASRYKAMTDTAVAKGEAPVQYGRVAAQCLHR